MKADKQYKRQRSNLAEKSLKPVHCGRIKRYYWADYNIKYTFPLNNHINIVIFRA